METQEIWKDIKGYEGRYMVSSLGRIKSLDRFSSKIRNNKPYNCRQKGSIMNLRANANGYIQIGLRKNDRQKQFVVHRIVANTFIENPLNKPTVNHINGIKTDNRIENLEWNTQSENIKHSFKMGLSSIPKGIHSPHSIPLSQFTKDGTLVRHWGSAKEIARETDYDQSAISKCVREGTNMAYGFIWKRTEQ